jgi:prolyl 4-hydroxylase
LKRLEIKSEKAPNFIGCWQIENSEICDDVIRFFENNQQLQAPGATAGGVKPEQKKSTDIAINPNDLSDSKYQAFANYFLILQSFFLDYKEQWPFLNKFLDTVHIGSFNVQRYLPGEHFSNLHSERTSISKLHRIFAFMTYLNDVEEGGTTDFHYYDLKIKPEQGKTLIWPAEWTHAHTGSILEGGKKYIITGWMNFPA